MIDKDNLFNVYQKCRALRNDVRMQILELIHDHSATGEEIANELGLVQSVCSSHLSLLQETGFVKFERKGHFKLFYPDYEAIGYFNNPLIFTEEIVNALEKENAIQSQIIDQMNTNIEIMKKLISNEK